MTFAVASLAALALPLALHAASAEPGRPVPAAADCAAALRIALPNAHISAASAVPSNDSLATAMSRTVASRPPSTRKRTSSHDSRTTGTAAPASAQTTFNSALEGTNRAEAAGDSPAGARVVDERLVPVRARHNGFL
jgi:hypothetical protein